MADQTDGKAAKASASDSPSIDRFDYLLRVDGQGENYNELRQKLMYFLVTSSIAVAAFAVQFYLRSVQGQSRYVSDVLHPWLLVAAVIAAVVAAGGALLSVQMTHRSIARHLRCRYERKLFDDLDEKEKKAWDRVNLTASVSLGVSFVAMFLEVLGFALFFYPAFSKG